MNTKTGVSLLKRKFYNILLELEHYKIGLISVWKGIKARGIKKVIEMYNTAMEDKKNDVKNGYDFGQFFNPYYSSYYDKNTNISLANYYQPVRTTPFNKLLKFLNPDTQKAFVDIGCGRGKALLLAKQYGFRELKGIDIIPELIESAKKNLDRHIVLNKKPHLEVKDALDYLLAPNDGTPLLK